MYKGNNKFQTRVIGSLLKLNNSSSVSRTDAPSFGSIYLNRPVDCKQIYVKRSKLRNKATDQSEKYYKHCHSYISRHCLTESGRDVPANYSCCNQIVRDPLLNLVLLTACGSVMAASNLLHKIATSSTVSETVGGISSLGSFVLGSIQASGRKLMSSGKQFLHKAQCFASNFENEFKTTTFAASIVALASMRAFQRGVCDRLKGALLPASNPNDGDDKRTVCLFLKTPSGYRLHDREQPVSDEEEIDEFYSLS